jgi:hypothetical protein
VLRPFAGRSDEPDLVALRELVPSASAPLTLSAEHLAAHPEHAGRRIVIGTMLPQAVPALVRDDATVLVALQTVVPGLDPSADVAGALLAALDAAPGSAVDVPPASGLREVERRPGGLAELPRLVDVLDPRPIEVTVHRGYEWWLPAPPDPDDGDPPPPSTTPEVAAALERANAGVVPTVRLSSVTAAYWCNPGERWHLRWVMPHPEEGLLDALARIAAAGTLTVGEGSRYVGAFRAGGLLVPVWDLAPGAEPETCEAPAAALRAELDRALADPRPLSTAERRLRAGVVARSVTLR